MQLVSYQQWKGSKVSTIVLPLSLWNRWSADHSIVERRRRRRWSRSKERASGSMKLGVGWRVRWERNRETTKWRRSMDGSLSRWLVERLSTKTTSLWFHTRRATDRDPGKEEERHKEKEVVNNSEFLWSGLVRSFGQDQRRCYTLWFLQRVVCLSIERGDQPCNDIEITDKWKWSMGKFDPQSCPYSTLQISSVCGWNDGTMKSRVSRITRFHLIPMICLRFLISYSLIYLILERMFRCTTVFLETMQFTREQERIGNDVSNEMNISFDVMLEEVFRQLCSLFLWFMKTFSLTINFICQGGSVYDSILAGDRQCCE